MRRLKVNRRSNWLVVMLAAFTMLTTGCETDSWFDQSTLGRFERTPIVQPILEKISIIEDDKGIQVSSDRVRPIDLIPDKKEYIIGPGDTVRVTIYELRVPGLDDVQDRRVGENGMIRLAIVNDGKNPDGSIDEGTQAAGKSVRQLEEAIKKKLNEKKKLLDATVTVQLLNSLQNTFSVFAQSTTGGTQSGTFVIPKPDFRLVEALTNARGIPGRTRTVYVIRQGQLQNVVSGDTYTPKDKDSKPKDEDKKPADDDPSDLIEGIDGGSDDSGAKKRPAPPTGVEESLTDESSKGRWVYVDGKPVLIKTGKSDDASDTASQDANLAELSKLVTQRIIEIPFQRLKAGDMRFNVIIRPGDIISVPDPNAGFVYVMGAINRPGAYTIPGEKELTMYRLVASAGGLTGLAWPNKVDLIRQLNDSEQAIVRLDLKAISEGTEPDIYLKANDIINIGTSGVAVPLAVFRNGLRMTYGFGFVLDRNFDNDVFGDQ